MHKQILLALSALLLSSPAMAAADDPSPPARLPIVPGREAPRPRLQPEDQAAKKRLVPAAAAAAKEPPPLSPAPGPKIGVAKQYPGPSGTGYTPPDPSLARSPGYVVSCVNPQTCKLTNTTTGASVVKTFGQMTGLSLTSYNGDPYVVYHRASHRFYFAGIDLGDASHYQLLYGWSTTDDPTKPWCGFKRDYGTTLPDYPKLGVGRFIEIGFNRYYGSSGSTILAYNWPATSVTTCQAPAVVGRDGVPFTPVPATTLGQDSSDQIEHMMSGSSLPVTDVTASATGAPVIGAARYVTLPYARSVPRAGVQKGATQVIDTLDGRPYQVFKIKRAGIWSLWSAIGSQIGDRPGAYWHVIDAHGPTVRLSGKLADATHDYYYPALSPDLSGNKGVLFSNESSTGEYVSGVAVGISSTGASTGKTLLKAGLGPVINFTCPNPGEECRWGDYHSAEPDQSVTGKVWGVVSYATTSSPDWGTVVTAATP